MRRGRGDERKRHQSRAALLHDAIEDSEVPKELIAETFENDVASIVVEVTDYKGLPKADRKPNQVETAAIKSPTAKVVKLAETGNLRAIAASPPSEWSVKRRMEYVDWARQVGPRASRLSRARRKAGDTGRLSRLVGSEFYTSAN